MSKTKIALLGFSSLLLILVGIGYYFNQENNKPVTAAQIEANQKKEKIAPAEKLTPADKIEIINFHSTARCVSCTTISELTQATIKERFASEYESGKITFSQYNVDLPENEAIAQKYQATGTAIFMNALTGQNENFKEYPKVWNYVTDETAFKNYLAQEINKLLGK